MLAGIKNVHKEMKTEINIAIFFKKCKTPDWIFREYFKG